MTATKSGRTYDTHVATRTTKKQRRAIERAAKKAGLDLGTYVRLVLLAASGASPVADDLARAKSAGAAK